MFASIQYINYYMISNICANFHHGRLICEIISQRDQATLQHSISHWYHSKLTHFKNILTRITNYVKNYEHSQSNKLLNCVSLREIQWPVQMYHVLGQNFYQCRFLIQNCPRIFLYSSSWFIFSMSKTV